MTKILGFIACFIPAILLAQPIIYKGGTTAITGTWNNFGTIAEVTSNAPYEGGQHYEFNYSLSSFYAGAGLNMDNWGASSSKNFSTYTHLRVFYRGLSGAQTFHVQLSDRTGAIGATYDAGPAQTNYTEVLIPILSLKGSSNLDLTQINTIQFMAGGVQSGSGTFYIDNIELINQNSTPVNSTLSWTRANSLGKGQNCANWLEAHWLGSAFPDPNVYTRADFAFWKSMGISHVRLPVQFESQSNPSTPYNLYTTNTVYRLVDSAIVWAQQLDLKLIIVNHHGNAITDGNYQAETPRLVGMWTNLAQRYANLDPDRYFFELRNEPDNQISNQNLFTLQQAIINAVRAQAPNHTLIVGANSWNSGAALTQSSPYNDGNIIYTWHSYDPYNFSHQGLSWTGLPSGVTFPSNANDMTDLQARFTAVKNWSNYWNRPVYLGEFGVSIHADATSRCNWIGAMGVQIDLHSMPSAYWDYDNSGGGFGYMTGSAMTFSNVTPCFATALHYQLNSPPVATSFPSPALVGYWQNWNDPSCPYIQLDAIDNRYNVVEVAFAIPTSNNDMTMVFTPDGATQSALISKIQTLQSQGKKVLLSIGGANATIDLTTTANKNAFVNSMTSIINTYGFDGIDIDIEHGNSILISGGTIAAPSSTAQVNLINAIKQIMSNYRASHQRKLLLTMAPETAYVQGGQSAFSNIWGGYLPIIHALRDSIDLLQVQLYNSGSMYGINGSIFTQGTADFIVAMTEATIQGFNTSGGFFTGLPASKIAVALPACPSAAGGGFVDTATVRAAINYLRGTGPRPGSYTLAQPAGYPTLGGMMTWSINWDATNSCATSYQFAQNYQNIFGGSNPGTNPCVDSNGQPTFQLAVSPASASTCAGSCTTLTAGSASSYIWSTGGTTASISACPTTSDSYCVTATNTAGCTATACATITVSATPQVNFSSVVNATNCLKLSFSSSASGGTAPYQYSWGFPGATPTSSNLASPSSVTFSTAGTYNVCLTVTDATGCSSSICKQVTVGGACNIGNVDFCYTVQQTSSTNTRITVSNVTSGCNGTPTIAYSYDGGTTWGTSTTYNTTTSNQVRNVCVRITCKVCGQTCIKYCCREVQIATPCSIVATAGITGINVANQGSFVAFTATSGFAGYDWDFNGDGVNEITNGTYSQTRTGIAPGNYTACVTMRRSADCFKKVCQPYAVGAPCSVVAAFQSSSCNTTPMTVNFTSASTGATTLNWNFGDGSTGSGATPSHSYTTPGTYTVCLTASSAPGCYMNACYSIKVGAVTCNPSNSLAMVANNEQTAENLDTELSMEAVETIQDIPLAAPAEDSGLLVYPNPSHEKLTIQFDMPEPSDVVLELYNLSGQLVWQQVGPALKGRNELSLNITEFKAGLYSLRLSSPSKQYNTLLSIIH